MSAHSVRDVPVPVLLRLLKAKRDGLPVGALIEAVIAEDYPAEAAINAVRLMLNRGDVSLGPDMNICLLKQTA